MWYEFVSLAHKTKKTLCAREKASYLFKQYFELSDKNRFDYHTVNAAHMLGIVAESVIDKIKKT